MNARDTQDHEIRIREGFPNQRLVVLPANVIERCRDLPMVAQLHVTHIGAFPSAPHHYVERNAGVPQPILIYCLEGEGWLELDGATFSIERGHATIIPSGMQHVYGANREAPWSIFWIHFAGLQAESIARYLGVDAKNPRVYVPEFQMMRYAFEDVYACLNYHYSDAGLLAMTSELLRLLSKIKLNSSLPQRGQPMTDHIQATIEFMEGHLDMLVSLEDLAARSGRSVPCYCRLFKQRTSQSPMAYFNQLKIRRACELLYQTDLRIKEIAAQLGYDDPYYFSRLFKKIQGCSPAHYRESVM